MSTQSRGSSRNKSRFWEQQGPSRRRMRNIVRWRNKRSVGNFAGRPRTNYRITIASNYQAQSIDAIYEATDEQFSRWANYLMSQAGRDEIIKVDRPISPEERVQILQDLDNFLRNPLDKPSQS